MGASVPLRLRKHVRDEWRARPMHCAGHKSILRGRILAEMGVRRGEIRRG